MKLPFANKLPQSYYEMALDEAHTLLSPQEGELVSIKVRPIEHWPINEAHHFTNAYLYPTEYKAAFRVLKRAKLRATREGSISRGRGTVYATQDGSEFLFVQHETGPEIIAYVGLATASVTLVTSIIQLITEILKKVNENNEAVKRGKFKERPKEIAAISIEERRAGQARIIKIIQLPVDQSEIELDEIAKRFLEHPN